MPFDGTEFEKDARTRLGRLLILRELLLTQNNDDQRCYGTCLWSAARQDERFLKAGLVPGMEPAAAAHVHGRGWVKPNGYEFFGVGSAFLFGYRSAAAKRERLDTMIARERAKAAILTQG